jgi:WD40 repeat protein
MTEMRLVSALTLFLALFPTLLLAEPPNQELPLGAVAQLGSYRFYHPGEIQSLAVSPDGTIIATVGGFFGNQNQKPHWQVCIWNAKSGECIHSLPIISNWWPHDVTFSHDGKSLAFGAGSSAFVLDASSGEQVRSISLPELCRHLLYSADDRQLIWIGVEDRVRWTDVATGQTIRDRSGWAMGRAKVISDYPQPGCTAFDISPNGQIAAFHMHYRSLDREEDWRLRNAPLPLRFLDLASGKIINEIDAGQPTEYLGLSPDGRSVALASNQLIRLVRVADGKTLSSWPHPDGGPVRGRFSPDGKCLACYCRDRQEIEVWEVETGRRIWSCLARIQGGDLAACSLLYTSDGKKLIIAQGAWIRRFDSQTGSEFIARPSHGDSIHHLAFAENGAVVRATTELKIDHWDLQGKMRGTFSRPLACEFYYTAVSEDRTLAARNHQQYGLVICNPATGAVVRRLKNADRPMHRSAFSSDNRFLVHEFVINNDENCLRLFDVGTSENMCEFSLRRGCHAIAFSIDGSRLAMLDGERTLLTFESTNGRTVSRIKNAIPENRPMPTSLVFSADVRTVCLPESTHAPFTDPEDPSRSIHLFHVDSGKEICCVTTQVKEFDGGVRNVAVSPDGRFLALVFGRDPGVCLLETGSGLPYCRLTGHRDNPMCAAFSPDGRWIATGGKDGVVLLWDLNYPLQENRRSLQSSSADLNRLWACLAGAEVPKAWAALAELGLRNDVLPFLRRQLRPVRAVSSDEMKQLIDALSASSFAERERAGRDIMSLEEPSIPYLEKALAEKMPAEGRKRAQALLDALRSPALAQNRLRQWRAVAALERIGTPDAVKLLEELAGGLPEARLTLAAKDALARLKGEPRP